ncbi:hypothetical protein VTK56DRAFT_4666 [Thermocarpiscus australiensis]
MLAQCAREFGSSGWRERVKQKARHWTHNNNPAKLVRGLKPTGNRCSQSHRTAGMRPGSNFYNTRSTVLHHASAPMQLLFP